MKIVVVGNYGNYNIGDETILKGFTNEITKTTKNDLNIYTPTRNVGFEKIYHYELNNIFSFYVYNFKDFLKYSLNADKIIVGGGGIWSGYTGKLAKLIPLYSILMSLTGKSVSFRSIGVYKTASLIERCLVNVSMLFSAESTVRDVESYEVCWKLLRRKVSIEDDLAIKYLRWLEKNNDKSKINEIIRHSKIYNKIKNLCKDKFVIGLSLKPIKNAKSNNNMLKTVVNVIKLINQKHSKDIFWLLFPFAKTPNPVEDDIQVMRIILENTGSKNVQIVDHDNPIVWYYIIKNFVDIFIGVRYHSLIFSWIAKKPFFGIAYENKCINFLRQIGHKNWSTVENIKAEDLIWFIEQHL